MAERIALIDDDPVQCELLGELLRAERYEVTSFTDAQKAVEELKTQPQHVDLVVSDVGMPGLDGIGVCQALREARPDLSVVVITGESRLETAVAALRAGAYDFLTKPIQPDVLVACVKRALERRALTKEIHALRKAQPSTIDGLFGQSEGMKSVRELVGRVAGAGANVLIQGETGTGKEVVARALHSLSPRAQGPFIALNCAALPAALLESELFGHAKGAFTDAKTARPGLFVEASGGTLFLDEVAELPPESQAKLLRALQERKARPVGSNTEVAFDARIVTATHKDLEAEVEAGRFRQDLFFRLNVITIDLPPLRERGMDVVRLAHLFLERTADRDGRQGLTLSPDVAQRLLSYPWPGNVRELENTIERAVALARLSQVTIDDLPEKVRHYQSEKFQVTADEPEEIVTLAELERRYVQRVLKVVNNNRSRAAQLLGIDRRTLYRRLEAMGQSNSSAANGAGPHDAEPDRVVPHAEA